MVDVLTTIRIEDKPDKHPRVFVGKYDFPRNRKAQMLCERNDMSRAWEKYF